MNNKNFKSLKNLSLMTSGITIGIIIQNFINLQNNYLFFICLILLIPGLIVASSTFQKSTVEKK